MSNHAEDVIFALLSDTESLEALIEDGMPLECIPTVDARPIVEWAKTYFMDSGMTRAPSIETIQEMWGQQLEDLEINLGDGTETDTIESAIEVLVKTYVELQAQEFVKGMATRISKALPTEKVTVLRDAAEQLFELSSQYDKHNTIAPSTTAAPAALARYEEREVAPTTFRGMSYGIEEVDEHYYGIHPGELAVFAAGPKVGKSWYSVIVALANWYLGLRTCLVTMENSLDMTWDRLMCIHAGIPYRAFQRGTLEPDKKDRLVASKETMESGNNPLLVLAPESGKRTARAIVESSRLKGADALIIDQLTFMEHPRPRGMARHEVIRDIMHDLKNGINGRTEVSALLLHQINREGMKAAAATGYHEMHHLAEGSEVERTADAVHALYQPLMDKDAGRAKYQGLAARREETNDWSLAWAPASGAPVKVLGEWIPAPSDPDKD